MQPSNNLILNRLKIKSTKTNKERYKLKNSSLDSMCSFIDTFSVDSIFQKLSLKLNYKNITKIT